MVLHLENLHMKTDRIVSLKNKKREIEREVQTLYYYHTTVRLAKNVGVILRLSVEHSPSNAYKIIC